MKYIKFLFMFILFSLTYIGTIWAANTVEVRVSDGNDDAEEQPNHSMYRSSSDLELTYDGGTQIVGIRFRSINVPKDATIIKAYIEFTVDETKHRNGQLSIYCEAHDNPPHFSSSRYDISNRTKTTSSVTWILDDDNVWTHVGDKKHTPDLKTIVQEVINRPGWNSGNSMVFIITGTGQRCAESYNGSHRKAPLLHIEYETGPPKPYIGVEPAGSLGASSYKGVNASPSTFTLSNLGKSDLHYTITDDSSWMQCSYGCSGTLPAGNSTTVGVIFSNYNMASGSYTGHFIITDNNGTAPNSPFEYDVNLLINELELGSTCGDVPIYAQNLVDPAILVLLDVSGSMKSLMSVTSSDDNPTTPDLSSIVQEIVDRPDWNSGQSMAFIIEGTGKRVAVSYDGVSSSAPLLKIKYTDGTEHTLNIRVAQTNDDAEERVSNGRMYNDSSDLELIQDGWREQVVGIRFQNVTIPKGANIISAVIEFVVDEPDPTTETNLTIYGEDIGNANEFDESSNYNISSRTKTSASVTWNITEQWTSPPKKARYVIGREVISDLVTDRSISWGFGTWSFSGHPGPGGSPNLNLLPSNPYGDSETDLFTRIRAGIEHRDEEETKALQTLIEQTTAYGGTPFGPSLLAAREYFAGRKPDEDGNYYNSNLQCQPKFLIDVTDGQGYPVHTTVDIINKYTNLLADEKISSVAVGFGIAPEEAAQIYEMAKVANERGNESENDGLYALHDEINDVGVPFIAMNQEELTNALKGITNTIKQQIFIGSSPAPSTSVDSGTFVINASFNAANWTGELTATPYSPENGNIMMCVDSSGNRTCDHDNIIGMCPDSGTDSCNTTEIIETECLCWSATDNMESTKNAWTVDGELSYSGTSANNTIGKYVDDHTSLSAYEIALDGDNYICKDLGDIIRSTPVIVESPHQYYSFDNYRAFRFGSARNRTDMLYVGANDGALHAFELISGNELWRFYPEAVHSKLLNTDLCGDDYCHEYFVDGTPVVADVFRGNDYITINDNEIIDPGWRTILITGLGAGGDAYFALDITSGAPFEEGEDNSLNATTYLWQFEDDELGLAIAKPAVSRTSSSTEDFGGWATYFASGYAADGSLNKEAYVFGIEAYTMNDLWLDGNNTTNRIKLQPNDRITCSTQISRSYLGKTIIGQNSSANATITDMADDNQTLILTNINGTFEENEMLQVEGTDITTVSIALHSAYVNDALSDPVIADLDFDNIGDYLYTGSMYGRLYRLINIGKGDQPQAELLFEVDPDQINLNTPIRAGATIGYDTAPNTIWLYFGTGRFEEQIDKFNTEQQYFIGIKDQLGSERTDNSTLTKLLDRQSIAVEANFNGNTEEYRIITGHSYVYEGNETLTTGMKIQGVTSGATGTINSLSFLNGNKTVTFQESSVEGTFIIGEQLKNADTNDKLNISLKNYPWYIKLVHSTGEASERVVASPIVVGGVVIFTTFTPDDDVCGGNGRAWLYAVDYQTGLPPAIPFFDVNGDGEYDEDDMINYNGVSYPIAAIPIGRGIPSAPVLEGNLLFINTTDSTHPGLPVNLPELKASISSWKDNSF